MIISVKSNVYDSENQLKIERLLCKIERLEQQLEMAQSGYCRSHPHKANTTKSTLSVDELSMLTKLF
ncbi:hypothetical protein JK628_16925 [Shewanella sp. KX20019]|uniref:hypothetical protein n=1 Tax=Shewanella sp. KX20019 TaxID=2803864 RepID=UPI001926DA36|nr:hypothetical protein [Shewanella sp. KX20019]QQX79224.1 hypothetical protein JK628_16925 [Shewanella sp. KX20019]